MYIIKEILKSISLYFLLVGSILLLYINSIQQGINVSILSICVLSSTLVLVIKHNYIFRNKLFYYITVVFHIALLITLVLIIFIYTPIIRKYDNHISNHTLNQNTTKIVK